MRIFEPNTIVTINDVTLAPGQRYVLPDGWAQKAWMQCREVSGQKPLGAFNAYERRFAGRDGNNKRVLLYRHSAFGDQLMATAVAAKLKRRWPRMTLHVCCEARVMDLWEGVPVDAVWPVPLTFDQARWYDYHILYEGMLEANGEPEQANAYDDLFGFIGLGDVGAVAKMPCCEVQDGDLSTWNALQGAGVKPRGYVLYQLQASNPNRTYPPKQGGIAMRRLLEARPELVLVLVGQNKRLTNTPPGNVALDEREQFYAGMAAEGAPGDALQGRVVDLIDRVPTFRELYPLAAHAGVIVTPDTAMAHLGAGFPETPVVSLWGLFSPDCRAKYYRNHTPLWPQTICPHAPCFAHTFTLPQERCAEAEQTAPQWTNGHALYCHVLAGIDPQVIADTCVLKLGKWGK